MHSPPKLTELRSERQSKTGASGQQMLEAQSINKSLTALGDVISALSSEAKFIPYRNNILTMLMQVRYRLCCVGPHCVTGLAWWKRQDTYVCKHISC